MKSLLLIFFWGLPVFSIAQSPVPLARPFALVELFTSQGCSSCPPAHQMLDKFSNDSSFGTDSVAIISFHVDYWNYLGWEDSFSRHTFTERQKEYSTVFGDENVYTPQLVVNGKSGFSGNNEARLRRELKAIQHGVKYESTGLEITSLKLNGDKLIFSYLPGKKVRNHSINATLVSIADTTVVAAGENSGSTLTSKNTVRAFLKLPMREEGSRAFLNIPVDEDKSRLRLIVWIQSLQEGGIMDIQVFDLP
ncbi:MAG: DUF1223 domain-containing protein [Bacteroidetes bacterium]|nr:DUF1223 domain-containing protein [Bacteroidota bacterium]